MLRRALIVALLTMALCWVTASPVDAAEEWKSTYSSDHVRLRWHSCTVHYAVDSNGRPGEGALRSAITNIEKVSGLDFKRVPWAQAELKVSFTSGKSGSLLGRARWWFTNHEVHRATVTIYQKAYRKSQATKINMFRHELGHVLGLAHVRGADVMNRSVKPGRSRTGWNNGLRWLYRSCR